MLPYARSRLVLLVAAAALLALGCQTPDTLDAPVPTPGTAEPGPRYGSPQSRPSLQAMFASREEPLSLEAIAPLGYAPGALASLPRGAIPREGPREGPRAPRVSLRRRLQGTLVPTFQVEDEDSLAAVAARLQATTGVSIVVHPSAEDEAYDAGAVFDFRFANPIALESLLDLVAELAGDEVVWRIRHGVVLFTARDRALDEYVLVMHDIRRLVAGRRDWVAPRLDRLQLLGDADDGDSFGAVGDRKAAFDEDAVLRLVTENVERESWDLEGTSIEVANGLLFVRHRPAVHQRIRALLAVLGN